VATRLRRRGRREPGWADGERGRGARLQEERSTTGHNGPPSEPFQDSDTAVQPVLARALNMY